jgi:hypothetical protein
MRVLAVVITGIALLNASVAGKEPLPKPNWTVKYDSGLPGLKSGQWLKVTFVQRAALLNVPSLSMNVSNEQLISVEYSAKAEKNAHLLQGPRSGCAYARALMSDPSKNPRPEALVAWVSREGAVSRFAERLISRHSVRFVWSESSSQRSATLKVNDCEYDSFVATIRWFVGSRWQEVGHDSGR